MIALQFGRLDVKLIPGPPTRVTMTGRIDDTSPIAELFSQIAPGEVVFDTNSVTFVNSFGMREWTRLLRSIHARGDKIWLEGVADVLMTHMNLIPEFKHAATIVSFHAQYVCSKCGHEATPLIDATANAQA